MTHTAVYFKWVKLIKEKKKERKHKWVRVAVQKLHILVQWENLPLR